MHLLSPPGIEALARITRQNTLLAFDFDGTLAPIVADPASARMSAATSHVLSMMCEYATVAVISGRGAADVRARVPAEIPIALGNHGIDGWGDSGVELDAAVDLEHLRSLCASWQSQLEEAFAKTGLPGRGIVLENKGATLAVHYRLARNRDDTAARLFELIGALQPAPRVLSGKFVYDLLAIDAMDKGTAIERLAERVRADSVLFVGDDEPDEAIFRAAPPSWVTVRVDRARDTAARFYLRNQTEVTVLLHRLMREYRSLTDDDRARARQAIA